MKRKPTGFIAICQCGIAVGAIDADRTNRNDAGKLLGRWLSDGCRIEPLFTEEWSVKIEPCNCADSATERKS